MDRRYVLGLLGLAARAGALSVGVGMVRDEVRDEAVDFVLVACDAAEGQKGKILPLLRARRIEYDEEFSGEELGRAIGRSRVSAVGIRQGTFSRQFREMSAGGDGGFRKIDDRRKLD